MGGKLTLHEDVIYYRKELNMPISVVKNRYNDYTIEIEGMPLHEGSITAKEAIVLLRGIGFYNVYKSYGKSLFGIKRCECGLIVMDALIYIAEKAGLKRDKCVCGKPIRIDRNG